MKIVITGGNGYLGARLSQYFAINGYHVIPVCFPLIPDNENWKSKMYKIIEGDLRQEKTIQEIAQLKPDIIIHLVSLDHFDSEKEPGFVNRINVLPTWRLLETCTKEGLNKFIYFSTIQVYGKLQNSTILETQPAKAANAYGLTHLLCEQICDYYNRKTVTNVCSVRLSNSYGDPIFQDNNCWWLAVNDICKNAFINKEIRLLSDGTPQRDFIHGSDVCKAIHRIINNTEKLPDNIYHISSGETWTLMELAKIIRQEYYKRYNVLIPVYTSEGQIQDIEQISPTEKYIISNNKIKRIGFSPSYSLSSGINELFTYLEQNCIKE